MKNQLSSDAAGHLQLEIDNLVQSFSEHIEDYDISSANYAVGDTLMYKNRLCSVVAAITVGDTFIVDDSDPNQNLEYVTIFEIAQGTPGVFYNTDADAEADIVNIPEGSMVYTNDGDDEPINARNIRYDDGTQAGSDVETQINNINSDLINLAEEVQNMGMPILDYANPLHTLTTSNWTATKDCYIVGSLYNRNTEPGVLYINDTQVMTTQNTSGINSNAYGQMSIPILKIKTGDTVRVSHQSSIVRAYEEIQ